MDRKTKRKERISRKAVEPEPGSVSHPTFYIGAVRLKVATGPRPLPLIKNKHERWGGQEKTSEGREYPQPPEAFRMKHRQTSKPA